MDGEKINKKPTTTMSFRFSLLMNNEHDQKLIAFFSLLTYAVIGTLHLVPQHFNPSPPLGQRSRHRLLSCLREFRTQSIACRVFVMHLIKWEEKSSERAYWFFSYFIALNVAASEAKIKGWFSIVLLSIVRDCLSELLTQLSSSKYVYEWWCLTIC